MLADALAAVRQAGESLRAEALRPVVLRLADASESLMREALDIVATMKSPDGVLGDLLPERGRQRFFLGCSRSHAVNMPSAIDRIRMLEFDANPASVGVGTPSVGCLITGVLNGAMDLRRDRAWSRSLSYPRPRFRTNRVRRFASSSFICACIGLELPGDVAGR